MKNNLVLILSISCLLYCSNAFCQDGMYKVGKTTCTIESSHTYFKVYWENGVGYTQLVFSERYPNGNEVFQEYEYKNNEPVYVGSFVFKNDEYLSGTYLRDDGKEFKVKRILNRQFQKKF